MEMNGRILTRNWDLYDTRHVVYKTSHLTAEELENGYHRAYSEFYSWSNILKSSFNHEAHKHKLKHLLYAGGWKKFEAVWNFIIKTRNLNNMLPLLESILAKVNPSNPLQGELEETTKREKDLPSVYSDPARFDTQPTIAET